MLLQTILRKSRQLASDPVLRSWLLGRAFGRWPGPPAFSAHQPPYLADILPLISEGWTTNFDAISSEPPKHPITLALAGLEVTLAPGEEEALFSKSFDDVETLLALHRFAWMTAAGDIDPAWVQALWQNWRKTFGTPSDHLAWHPYTAGERVTNILGFARAHGLPGPVDDTLSVLAAHGPAIATRLEYFGDHHTSNHLANNGRGLYFLGVMLGMENAAVLGLRILLEEARRIILPSGMLREGSSHYHFLVLRLYQRAADLAAAYERPEVADLNAIYEKLKGPAAALLLPAGLPLIGDISPDITPHKLISDLALPPAPGPETMAADGWLRFDSGPWSGLWHAAPEGFSHMPGHGHQDMGGFELHYENEAVIVDAGRGAYGETGEAALYRSAQVHSVLSIDGHDPYPANRPYYDDKFRRHIAGPGPELTTTADGVSLRHHGGRNDQHFRLWKFAGDHLTISDNLAGSGSHHIVRRLVSPLAAEISDGAALLQGNKKTYRVACQGVEPVLQPITCWRAYAQGAPGSMIVFAQPETLPFEGALNVEVF